MCARSFGCKTSKEFLLLFWLHTFLPKSKKIYNEQNQIKIGARLLPPPLHLFPLFLVREIQRN
jgi:hypothetical protein